MVIMSKAFGFIFRRLNPNVKKKIYSMVKNNYNPLSQEESKFIYLPSGRKLYFNPTKGGRRFNQLKRDLLYLKDNEETVPYSTTKEPETVQWINSFPEDILLWDIGANCGTYTLYAAIEKNCKVLAFEPSFSNFSALNENILLNCIDDRIRAFCLAFHNKKSIEGLQMKKTKVGGSGSSFEDPVDHKGEVYEPYFVQGVIGISIDQFINEYSAVIPNAIKIDVDGNEEKILQGAKETLKDDNVKFISIELNEARLEYMKRVNHLLYECGFTFIDKAIASKERLGEKDYNKSSDQSYNYHFEKLRN